MKRCWAITRNLNRCQRTGEWRFFCEEHRRQPVCWIVFLIFTVIAGIASIRSGFFASESTPLRLVGHRTNTVLRIRPDDNSILIPSINDSGTKQMALPLVLWCDSGETCDLDGIVMQQFDPASGRLVGPVSSLTDQNGRSVSFPLRIADNTKTLVVLKFPIGAGNVTNLKARVKFIGYRARDTTAVDVEIERQSNGYRGLVMSHDRLYNFGTVRGVGAHTVEFLKPYKVTPDVMVRQH